MFSSRRRTAATTGPHVRTSPSTARGGLFSRLTGGPKTRSQTTTSRRSRGHTTTARHGYAAQSQPVHHHKRRPSIGDKVSGALLKIKGSLTGRPGKKAAGTKRMRGTDGRGARHTVAPVGTTGRRTRRTRRTRY